MPIANGQQPTAKSYGFYAKASANIAYPIPGIFGSVGYEFNKHFAIGIGGGVISAAFYDICFPLSLEISGDITKNNIIGKIKILPIFYQTNYCLHIKLHEHYFYQFQLALVVLTH